MIARLFRSVLRADARRREHDYITAVLHGPETTFRSELVEMMSRVTPR